MTALTEGQIGVDPTLTFVGMAKRYLDFFFSLHNTYVTDFAMLWERSLSIELGATCSTDWKFDFFLHSASLNT